MYDVGSHIQLNIVFVLSIGLGTATISKVMLNFILLTDDGNAQEISNIIPYIHAPGKYSATISFTRNIRLLDKNEVGERVLTVNINVTWPAYIDLAVLEDTNNIARAGLSH